MALVTDVPNRNDPIVDPVSGVASEALYIWMALLTDLLESGYTGTITTAALTGLGAQGSMTFQNGILISQVQAT